MAEGPGTSPSGQDGVNFGQWRVEVPGLAAGKRSPGENRSMEREGPGSHDCGSPSVAVGESLKFSLAMDLVLLVPKKTWSHH